MSEEESKEPAGFVDTKTVFKTIETPISDEALIAIGDEMSEKIVRKATLEKQINDYVGGRRKEIKSLLEELEPLAEQFNKKTEGVSTECVRICDFEAGKIRFETVDGELIDEEEMPTEGFQREFDELMGADIGKELIEKAAELIRREIDALDTENGDSLTETEAAGIISEELAVSDSIATRIFYNLRTSGAVHGRGDELSPFRMKPEGEDVEESAEEVVASGAKSAGITEDDILAAVTAVVDTQRAKSATLTRKMEINPNRAADLMDILEQRGVVSPDDGEGREVLMDVDQYLDSVKADEASTEED
jgi:DNA segregation ATPase FtsK/SpoIIIE-like protein